jgi:hypothetical protein
VSILLLLLGQVQFYFHFIADSQCLKAPISLALRTTIRTGPKLTGEAAGTNPLISSDDSSNRCGVLIDGQYIEPQSGRDKITYECGCLDKSTQCIVWGFVLSEDHKTPPTPAPIDSPPLPVQNIPAARVKVIMQRQTHSVDAPSTTRVETLLSDSPRLNPPPESPLPPLRAATVRTFRMLSCNPFEKTNFNAAGAGSPRSPHQNPVGVTLDPHPGGVDSQSMNVDPVYKLPRNPQGRRGGVLRCDLCRSQKKIVRSRCPSQ